MADPVPNPTPTPKQWAFWQPIVMTIAKYAGMLIAGALAAHYGFKPADIQVPVPVPGPAAPEFFGEPGAKLIATADRSRPTGGWVRDRDQIAANLDPVKTEHFDRTPAGKVVMGDQDMFLWQAVRRVNNKAPPWYPNIDQKQVGCCTGCGWKHAADVCLAFQILAGQPGEWKACSAEVMYGGGRVEGRPQGASPIRGDGGVGAWVANWVKLGGIAPMEKYQSSDLSVFSPAKARQFGKSGVPADIEASAKLHPVKTTALVKSWSDVKRAIQQGFPIAVCSGQGFTMARDATGTCHPSGSWSHCMAIIGYRSLNGKDQGFILNSWGDQAMTGPVSPADAPVAGFWADSNVIEGMVSEGDSFALSEVVGFPARVVPVDWFSRAEPKRKPAPLFALDPIGALAW